MKLLSVSSDVLIPTYVYNINGSSLGVYLYYDATIEYFGEEHLPYGVLAVGCPGGLYPLPFTASATVSNAVLSAVS